MTNAVRREILAVDKDQAVFNVTTLEELRGESILTRKFFMLLLLVFAGLALTLAAVGIYGVMSMSRPSAHMKSEYAWRSARRQKTF